MAAQKSFRSAAAFGKRMDYWIIGRMLKEGLDVYVPLVDDHAVDAIVKRHDRSTALIQIKAVETMGAKRGLWADTATQPQREWSKTFLIILV